MVQSSCFKFVAIAAVFLSCSVGNPLQTGTTDQSVSPIEGPGTFGISQLKGLEKRLAKTAVVSGRTADFDLGSIRGSSAFYFLLYNVGKSKITGVTLRVTDSLNFSAYPSTIDTLVQGTDVGMLPIVKIVAYHGSAIDGAGYRSLMTMGRHSTELVISGTTKTGFGKDTSIILTAGLNLNALVMDVAVSLDDHPVDMAIPSGNMGGIATLDGIDIADVRYYGMGDTSSSRIKIRNTGNVPVNFTAWNYLWPGDPVDTVQKFLDVGDSVAIPRGIRYPNSTVFPFICLDGNHTVTDYLRLPLQSDGRCYFIMYY
jgi:hypothetical protein